MASEMMSDPFNNAWSEGQIGPRNGEPLNPAESRDAVLPELDAQTPTPTPLDDVVVDAGEGIPDIEPYRSPWADMDLLSDPKDAEKGPTAFQRKEINWSDGNPASPKAVDDSGADFLEVDYAFGRKEGATDKPVLAANVFGRQFTAEELNRDDEGRKLLELMEYRRSGKVNEGGTLSRFASGFGAWSKSDIPFYGWVSDIGASAGDAIDMSKTFRKLQNGEKVTPHEAIQVRRFMLQQEIEGQRSMAYNVGSITRQAIGFMAEMYATSLAGAAVGAVFGGGVGAVPGAIVGAALAPLKLVLGLGRKGAAVGARKVANAGMAAVAKKIAAGTATDAELVSVARTGAEMYGRAGYRSFVKEAMAEAAKDASLTGRTAIRNRARQMIAEELSYARKLPESSAKMASRALFSADYRIALEQGMKAGVEQKAASRVLADVSKLKGMTTAQRNDLLREGIRGMIADKSWDSYVKGVAKGVVEGQGKTLEELVRKGLADTTGQWISPQFATKVAEEVGSNLLKNMELRYGGRAFDSVPRLVNYFKEHIVRGFVQSEHAVGLAMNPTIAHGGFGAFTRCSDALKEGIGRVFVEAPVRAAVQMGVAVPVGAAIGSATSGHDISDTVFKGQLGFMANALVTGDRENMESARAVAMGSMFVEYMSENAGAGLAPMLGGAIGTAVSRTPAGSGFSKAFSETVRNRVFTPVTKRTGAILDRVVAATFGRDAFKDGTEKLAGYGVDVVSRMARKAGVTVPEAEVHRAFATRSLDGIGDAFRSVLQKSGIKTYSGLKYAVSKNVSDGGRLQALRNFVGATLLERGFTPDRVVQMFRQAGFGGILEEMGEERLGDVVRGLFHLDDSASDAEIKEHLTRAFSGFTDLNQLATEFIGFAIPGGIRRAAIGSQLWLANGSLGKVRAHVDSANSILRVARGKPSVIAPMSTADAERLAKVDADTAALRDKALGTTAANEEAIVANAAALYANVSRAEDKASGRKSGKDELRDAIVAAGGLKAASRADSAEGIESEIDNAQFENVAGATSEEGMRTKLREFAAQLLEQPNEGMLEKAIANRGAAVILGEEGVNAVRREWRKAQGHEFGEDSPIEKSLADWKAARAEAFHATVEDETAESAAHKLYGIAVGRGNRSVTAGAEERANRGGTEVLVDENVRDIAVENVAEVCRYLGRVANRTEARMSLGRRALSRAIGFLGAAATGDLSLAASNPAAWLAQDAGLDKNLLLLGATAYNAGLLAGYAEVSKSFNDDLKKAFGDIRTPAQLQAKLQELQGTGIPADLYERIEEAGRSTYESRIRQAVTDYLAMSGIMMTTKEDADRMARDVVATRTGDTSSDRYGEAFLNAHRAEIAKARAEIVDGVIALARNAIGYSSKGGAGDYRTVVTVDVAEAIRHVNDRELLAAILASPAYRNVAKVANVSGLSEHLRENVLSLMTASHGEVNRICEVDENAEIDERHLAEIMSYLEADVSDYTPEEVQEIARRTVKQVKLAREGMRTTWSRMDADGKLVIATVSPVGAGQVVISSEGSVSEPMPMDAAAESLAADGFAADEQRIIVSNVKYVASEDATSLLSFFCGNDPAELKAEIVRRWGDMAETVDERFLPPVCREKYKNDPEGAVAQFRRELALAKAYRENGSKAGKDAKAAYESVYGVLDKDEDKLLRNVGYESMAERILIDRGCRRNTASVTATELNNISAGTDAWIGPVTQVRHDNAIVLSRDYGVLGNSEAVLRESISRAILAYVAGPESKARNRLFVDAYKEFRRVGDELVNELKASRRTADRAKRLHTILDAAVPFRTTGVGPGELAAIASSSVLFTCDRAAYGEGNGFLGATELAAVADRFRATDIFPVFVSALDEALGGSGFFRAASTEGKVDKSRGLSRYLAAFSPDPAELKDARRGSVFGDKTGDGKDDFVRPFISAIRLDIHEEGGKTIAGGIVRDDSVGEADGTRLRVKSFDGVYPYLQTIFASCQRFATNYEAANGGTGTILSAAQVHTMMTRADIEGGETAPAPEVKASFGVEGLDDAPMRGTARRALEAAEGSVADASEMKPAVREAFGAALRFLANDSGMKPEKYLSRVKERLLDLGVPRDTVDQIAASYDATSIVSRKPAEQEAEDAVNGRNAALEEAEKSESTNNPDSSVREAELLTNQDIAVLSGVMRYTFPDLQGNVSATMLQLRKSITDGSVLSDRALDEAGLGDAKADVASLVRAIGVNGDLTNLVPNLAKSAFEYVGPDRVQRLNRILDSAVSAYSRLGKFEYALALAAIRNVPDRNGRRTKMLKMLAEATPTAPMRLERTEPGAAFSILPNRSHVREDAVSAVVRSGYTYLLSSDRLDGLFEGRKVKDPAKLAEHVAWIRNALYGAIRTKDGTVRVPAKGEDTSSLRLGRTMASGVHAFQYGGRNVMSAVPQKDYEALMSVLGKSPVPAADFVAALDRVTALLRDKMEKAAQGLDALVGTGSMYSRILRSGYALAEMRRNAEESYELAKSGSETDAEFSSRKAAPVRALLNMANWLTSVDNPVKSAHPNGLVRGSQFLHDVLIEPLEGLVLRITGTRFSFRDASLRDAAKLAETLAAKMDGMTRADLRAILSDMGTQKVQTGMHLEAGVSADEAYRAVTGGAVDYGAFREQFPLNVLVASYVAGQPVSASRMSGRAKNAAEGASSRSVQTMPSMLPGFVRLVNSDIAKAAGIQREMLENGNTWADGSNPVASFVGAKDSNGQVLDREVLAGVLAKSVRATLTGEGPLHWHFPFFRADKPSCYAVQMPAQAVERMLDAVRGNEKLRDSLPPKILELVKPVLGKAAADLNARYDAAYALVATMLGQSEIDPKRIPVISSLGPIVAAYQTADEDGAEPDPKAGLYVVSTVGGVTGASLMGGYNYFGVLADRISAQCEGDWSEAQKVHMFSPQRGVNFKKGQATARRFRDYLLGNVRITNGATRFSVEQCCREIERAAGLKKGILTPLVEKAESQDQAEYDQYVRELNEAIAEGERFLSVATVMGDDLETNKAGLFGSSCGFSELDVDGKPLPEIRIEGKQLLKRDADGNWTAGEDMPSTFTVDIYGEIKNGQIPVAMLLSAYAQVKQDVETTNEAGDKVMTKGYAQVNAATIEAVWRKPDGTVVKGTMKDAGLLDPGERLTFRFDEANRVSTMHYFTRNMAAQLVASNANSSKVSKDHVFPTNATRDHWMVEAIRNEMAGTDSRAFLDAHSGYSLLQLADIARNPRTWMGKVVGDPELSSLLAKHPNDNEVRDAVSARMRSFHENQAIVGFLGNHGIMVPSGSKVVAGDEFIHTVTVEWAAGMTQYDRDCYRPARVFSPAKRDYYRTRFGTNMDRDWASGSLNVSSKTKGWRYGMYMDEAKFDALVRDIAVAADEVSGLAAAEGCDPADAKRALQVRGFLEKWYDRPDIQRQLLGCFTDYSGRPASESPYAKNASFDDLWFTGADGSRHFDMAAIGIGSGRRTDATPEAKSCIYLAGSPFHAHRSPSGNIQAACGTVRVTCPYEYDPRTGEAGPESKYALDPVTTANQGSDMDGDSASIQVYDYNAKYDITAKDMRAFTDAVLAGADVWAYAAEHNWLETRDGETHVAPSVLDQFARQVFTAQLDNYREMPTFHQGYCPSEVLEDSSKGADGAYFAEHYSGAAGQKALADANAANPANVETIFADYGFAGRHPVGTDAVFGEPLDARSSKWILDGLPAALARKMEGVLKPGVPMNKALGKAVDAIRGMTDMSLEKLDTAAATSDAASDSAKGRGISVANQSLFLRAVAMKLGVRGIPTWNEAIRYSPVIDLTAHIDGISNNLFDTLKKMFATRAGWTVQSLPQFLGRLVVRADEEFASDEGFRIDNKFVLREAILFLNELYGDKGPRTDTVLGALAYFTDPVEGRNRALEAAREAFAPNERGELWIGRAKIDDRASAQQVFRAVVRATDGDYAPVGADAQAIRAAVILAGLDTSKRKVQEQYRTAIAVAGALDSAKGIRSHVDYMNFSGKDLATVVRKADDNMKQGESYVDRTVPMRMASDDVALQMEVVDRFADSVARFADSSETLSLHINGSTERKPYDFAEGSALRDNFNRMIHLAGAYRLCGNALVTRMATRKGMSEKPDPKTGKFYETETVSTANLIRSIADTARYVSQKAAYQFARGTKTDTPVRRFLMSLRVTGTDIGLLGRPGVSEVESLREGFAQLASSGVKVAVRETVVENGRVTSRDTGAVLTGREFANLLVLHAAMTRPFGASTDYITQSTLPAAFGDTLVASLEAWRPAILGNEMALLSLGVKPVRVGRTEAYDLLGTVPYLEKDADTGKKEKRETPVTAVLEGLRPEDGVRLDDPLADLIRENADVPAVVGWDKVDCEAGFVSVSASDRDWAAEIDPAVATPMDGRTEFCGPDGRALEVFPVPVYRDGEIVIPNEPEFATSPEEAFNRLLASYDSQLDRAGERYAEAKDYFDLNGRARYLGRENRRASVLRDIVREAAMRSPELYDIIASTRWSPVRFPSRELTRAYNAVREMEGRDEFDRPQAAEVRAAYGAGETVVATRPSFSSRAEDLFPGEFTEKDAESTRTAIASAFGRVFGADSVDVTSVTDGEGRDTNLLRVTRKLGDKSVTTFVRIGETPTPASSAKAVAQSLAATLKGEGRDVSADDILKMGEANVLELGRMMSRFRQKGGSVPGQSLDFAPAMSGVIELSADADFRTLFHEYFHQMAEFFRANGILDAEGEAAMAAEFGDEEQAANAYAKYLTGIGNGADDVQLRKFLGLGDRTAALFARFREVSKELAKAAYAGNDPEGNPVFANLTVFLGRLDSAQQAKLTAVNEADLADAERRILGRGGRISDAVTTPERLENMRQAMESALAELANGDPVFASTYIETFRKTDVPTTVVRRAPKVEVATKSSEVTAAGRVQAFISKALSRYRRDGMTSDLADALKDYASWAADECPICSPNAGLFYSIRRFVRYVAEAEGIVIAGEDGRLNETGLELLSNGTVAELAGRFLTNAAGEREELYGEYNRDDHAAADWAMSRALETVAPSSYGSFARAAAQRSASSFLRLAEALERRSDRTEATDAAAAEFRRKAAEIVRYTEAIVRGEDIRHLVHRTDDSSEQPYGLLFRMFTGAAGFGTKAGRHYSGDGILHYDLEQAHANVLSLGDSACDPLITAAYDDAAQALFTGMAGRKYRAVMQGSAEKDEGQPAPEGVGEETAPAELTAAEELAVQEGLKEIGVEPGEAAKALRETGLAPVNASRPAVPEDFLETVDTDHTRPDFILADPGRWLYSDIQENLGGVNIREAMTDHTVQAECESKYRLASDWIQFFGMETRVGDGVRALSYVESNLGRNESGDFAIRKDYAHEVEAFSNTRGCLFGIFNWSEKRVGDPVTERDWQNAQYAGQAIREIAMRHHEILTGIRLGNYTGTTDLAHLRSDASAWFSPKAVLGRRVKGAMTALDQTLLQILDGQLGDVVLGSRDMAAYETLGEVPAKGLYGDFVRALEGAAKENAYAGPVRMRKAMEAALVRAGVAHVGTKKAVVAVSMKRAVDAWNGSAMKEKLAKAGRPASMLNPYLWGARFAKAVRELNDAASRSSYLSIGHGTSFSLAGTNRFWLYGGTGSHVARASAYRNAAEALEGMTPSAEAVLREKHAELFDIMANAGNPAKLRAKAFNADAKLCQLSDAQLRYLATLIGVTTRDEKGFDVRLFERELAAGLFAKPYRGSTRTIRGDETVFDMLCMINELVTDEAYRSLQTAKDAAVAEKQDLLDYLVAADIAANRLRAAMPGSVVAADSIAEFDRTGRLGDSRTAAESLIQMCRDLTTAERFRGCLAQMLASVSADGTPNFVVDPDDAMVRVERMPDEYWGAIARHEIRYLRTKFEGVPAYDDAATGVENCRRVFRFASEDKSGAYRPLDVDRYGARGMFNGILCRYDANDQAGNYNPLTAAQGGEAACYMKQLLGTVKAPTTEAAWRWYDRLTSWSKISSVGFSAFFQIATAFESPTAAVGFWKTFIGQQSALGKAMSKAYHALGHDVPLINDIIPLLNSNDPFVTEARELCDLIGMPLDFSVDFQNDPDDSNPVLGSARGVKADIERVSRNAEAFLGAKTGKAVRKGLEFMYKHPTDYTFNVVLNGVKMAVVMQTMRRLREECLAGNRPFDPVAVMRKYAPYINAEIGGIDPARYAWATPGMRRLLSNVMFSWQWTLGAWAAGGGEAISDILFGGHSSSPELRHQSLVRWVRMLGIVKFGVPVFMQLFVKAFSEIAKNFLPPPPDGEEDELAKEIDDMPWFAFSNESKAGALSFDVTPLLKIAGRVPAIRAAKEADVPFISAVIPAYVGGGRNTTGKRRYYMHFGKQSDEFFRWFTDAPSQFISKTSIPLQKIAEGIWGSLSPNGFTKAFADKGFAERWLNLCFDADQSALWNFVSGMGKSFSWESISSNPDAGFLAAVGPMRMGQSKRSTRLRIVERLKEFAEDDRANNPWSYARNRRKLNLLCLDILREGQLNGVDPADIMTSALGDVAHAEYVKLFEAMPKDLKGTPDIPKMQEAIRALARVNRRFSDIKSNVVQKYKDAGTDIKRNKAYYRASTDLIRSTLGSPFLFDDAEAQERFDRVYTLVDRAVRSTQMDAKGGENFGNFLATDEVPETLFGVPVVTRDYTTEDLEFFREHPEAGGFYDLGDDEPEDTPPDEPPAGPEGPENGATKAGRTTRRRSARATDPMLDVAKLDDSNPSADRALQKGGRVTRRRKARDADRMLDRKLLDARSNDMRLDIVKRAKRRKAKSRRADAKGGETFADRANAAVAETIDFLRSHEGFRKDAYLDTEGVPTIGYGQTNILGRAVTLADKGMSEAEAAKWMETRVRENAEKLYKRHPWMQRLSGGALAAAYDLAYNMGDGIFTKANSPGFNRRLDAGEDPEKVFWSELPTYLGGKDADARTRKGLKNRREDAIRRWKK